MKVLLLLALLLTGRAALASDDRGPWRWREFGVIERLTYRHNHDGTNFSTLAQWSPRYELSHAIRLGADLGFAPMKQTEDSWFLGLRYELSAEFFADHPVYPELVLGAESWATPGGFTSAVLGLNAHVRTDWNFVRSLVAGFHLVRSRDYMSRQVNIGLRLSF